MVKVKAFKGHLANQENVDKIISLPYDVLSAEEAKEAAEGNPMIFYHVNKPEIDLPEPIEDKTLIYE